MADIKRGYVPSDEKEFGQNALPLLKRAQQDILYLLEQGYPIKSASTYVGNHYILSERQRIAIVRATANSETLIMRRNKQLPVKGPYKKVAIDGFNVIITLEVALSASTLIRCMDGTIRDLAGLRGTYRIIDKTEKAIELLGDKLSELQIEEAVIYLDSPVSNTGRLKQKILDLLSEKPYQVLVELVDNADVILERLDHVVTQDSIILNKCLNWINLTADIITKKLPQTTYIDLGQ